jgi:flagellar operon protein
VAIDAGLNSLGKVNPAAGEITTQQQPGPNSPQAAEFRGALDQAVGSSLTNGAGAVARPNAIGAQALEALTKTQPPQLSSSLKFSAHAIERMRSRGISYAPETMKSIESAVQKAAAKGSKDTLVLTNDSALVVSVKNNTVVTVMDRNAMKENVFTNIDSTVMV